MASHVFCICKMHYLNDLYKTYMFKKLGEIQSAIYQMI